MIDSQLLNVFSECGTKFYYNFVMNVRTLFRPEAFDKGDLLHHMLKFHYKLLKHNQLALTNTEQKLRKYSYTEIMKICINKAEKHLLTLDLDIELGQEVIKTYKQYAEYYSNESWQIMEVERPFAKVLWEDDELKIVYCGIIDLLTHVAIVDHKSSSRRGNISGLSNQFMGYAWAFNLYNVVINKIGFQKTLKPEEKFERPTMSYPSAIIEEWKVNTINTAQNLFMMLRNLPEMSRHRNFTACDKYSGCIYQKICGTTPDAREFIISKDYLIGEPWQPVKGLSVK